MSKSPAEIKAEILRLTREFSAVTHAANHPALASIETAVSSSIHVLTGNEARSKLRNDRVKLVKFYSSLSDLRLKYNLLAGLKSLVTVQPASFFRWAKIVSSQKYEC